MKEVAWIGKRSDFDRQFHTHNGEFYNKETDTMYYCISTEYSACGRSFDEVQIGWYYPNNMNKLYDEIINTRMKRSE